MTLSVVDEGPGDRPGGSAPGVSTLLAGRQVEARTEGRAGLGLAIVRQIAEAHGGRVELESALGEGSRFTLRLPRG